MLRRHISASFQRKPPNSSFSSIMSFVAMRNTLTEIQLAKRPEPGKPVTNDCFKILNEEGNPLETSTEPKHTLFHQQQRKVNEIDYLITVKPLHFSVDPYLRCQFDSKTGVDYVQPYQVGKHITSLGVGIVENVESVCSEFPAASSENNPTSSPKAKKGDFVMTEGMSWPWRNKLFFVRDGVLNSAKDDVVSRQLVSDSQLSVLPAIPGITQETIQHFLGVFGATGLTAYFGILKETNLWKEENSSGTKEKKVVVISSAAGATGHIAAQLAKLSPYYDVHVIGLTRSDEKCKLLQDYNICQSVINYKKFSKMEDLRDEILRCCSGAVDSKKHEVDVYFDSVGGVISQAVHRTMAKKDSQIVLCGQISTYNDASLHPEEDYPPPLSREEQKILFEDRNVTRKRYLVLQYQQHFQGAIGHLMQLVHGGKLIPIDTVVEKLENAPEAFIGVMEGKNVGKMVVKV